MRYRFTGLLLSSVLAGPSCMGAVDEPSAMGDTEDEPENEPENEPCFGHDVGESWEPDACNVCVCTAPGSICTDAPCDDRPERERASGLAMCDGHALGEMWFEDCNTCWCRPDGVQCTRVRCPAGEVL